MTSKMERSKFIKTCGWSCLGILGSLPMLQSCAGTKYLEGTISGSLLEIPVNAFEIVKKEGEVAFRSYVVAQNKILQYPICVYRNSVDDYRALLMKCTHQGTELQVFGDRLQCPAHGSEFTKTGVVQNGPAEEDLRILPVSIEARILKINLS